MVEFHIIHLFLVCQSLKEQKYLMVHQVDLVVEVVVTADKHQVDLEILPLHHPLKEVMVVLELMLVVLTLVEVVVEPLQ